MPREMEMFVVGERVVILASMRVGVIEAFLPDGSIQVKCDGDVILQVKCGDIDEV